MLIDSKLWRILFNECISRFPIQKDGKYLDYFRYPSLVEKWKDIIRCQTWHDDQVFVEERLAALNPMSLERVTADIGRNMTSINAWQQKDDQEWFLFP